MRLSAEQVEVIRSRVERSGVNLKPLQEDLVDHLCCVLENDATAGVSFESKLDKAIADLAPEGLVRIEHATIFLLNHKKLIYMKKFMYVVGLGSSISTALGLCFIILNWQGGHELLIYGFLTFTLLFLPLTIVDRFKVRIQKSLTERLKYLLGALSAILAGISMLFKILHLAGADQLLLAAAVIFSFGFLPFLFFTNYRKAVEQHL